MLGKNKSVVYQDDVQEQDSDKKIDVEKESENNLNENKGE
jgi:hypothetical protein